MFGAITGILASRNRILADSLVPLNLYGASFSYVSITPTVVPITISNGTFSFRQDNTLPAPLLPIKYESTTGLNQTTVLLHFDGDFSDSSTYALLNAASNSATISTGAKFGSGAFSPGADGYLFVGSHAAQDVSTGDFTVECWVKPEQASIGIIVTKSTGTTYYPYQVFISADNRIHARGFDDLDTALVFDLTSTPVTLGQWHYIGLRRLGNQIELWVNGNLESSTTYSGNLHGNTNSIIVGAHDTGDYPFNGVIDEVRVSSIAQDLSIIRTSAFSTRVQNLGASYIGNIETMPITLLTTLEDRYWSNVDLLLKGNGTVQDYSPFQRTMTKVGSPATTTDAKFGSGALQFSGTGQALTTAISGFYNSDYTIEFWIKFNSIPSSGQLGIMGNLPAASYWFIGVDFMGQIFSTMLGQPSITTSPLNTGTWYYIAVTRDASAHKIYVDGVLHGSSTGNTTLTDQTIKIGKYSDSDMGVDAIIDDLRITTGVVRPISVPTAEFYSEITLAPELPTVTINDVSVLESVGTAAFTVSLSNTFSAPVLVNYQTVSGSALADIDFVSTAGVLTIPAGQTTGSITITVMDDGSPEGVETFTLQLSNPVNAVITDGVGTCTILGHLVSNSTVLNALDLSADVVLSNGDLTATETSGSEAHVRAVDGFSAGKYYWEILCNVAGSLNTALGIRSASETITTSFGGGATWVARSTGATYVGNTGASVSGSASWNAGDTVMLAVDKDLGKMWVGVNGVWAGSGDPALGLNPMFTGTLPGVWKPYIAADNTGSNHTWTARFSVNDMAYTMPSGFQEVVQTAPPPPTGQTFQFWRLYVTANDGDGTYVSFSDIKLYDNADVEYATAAGSTATQFGNGAVGSATNGADNNADTEAGSSIVGSLSSNPYWWQIDLGQERTISYMKLRSQRVVTGRTPSSFILQGAASASGPWTDAITVTGSTGWGIQEERTFTV